MEQVNETYEETESDINEDIKKNVGCAHAWFKAAFIVICVMNLINIIASLTMLIISGSNNPFIFSIEYGFALAVNLILYYAFFISRTDGYSILNDKGNFQCVSYCSSIFSILLVNLFLGLLFSAFKNASAVGTMGYFSYLTGYIWGIGLIPFCVGRVYWITAHILFNKKYNSTEKNIVTADKREILTNKYLSKTGKLFFVKYFEKLKTLDIYDIADNIDKIYTKENLIERIKNGKKIFENGLEFVALRIIIENSIDKETTEKAKSLMKKYVNEIDNS